MSWPQILPTWFREWSLGSLLSSHTRAPRTLTEKGLPVLEGKPQSQRSPTQSGPARLAPFLSALIPATYANSCHLGASTHVAPSTWGALCPHWGPHFTASPLPAQTPLPPRSLAASPTSRQLEDFPAPSHTAILSIRSVTLIRLLNLFGFKFPSPGRSKL